DPAAVAVAIAGPGDAALVGGRGAGVVAPVDGRAARQQGVGLRATAVVGQRREHRVDGVVGRAHLVALDAVDEAGAAGAVADEVAAGAGEGANNVGADAVEIDQVPGDDGIADAGSAVGPEEDAAAGVGAVVGDGVVEQGQGEGVDAAALGTGGVAAD